MRTINYKNFKITVEDNIMYYPLELQLQIKSNIDEFKIELIKQFNIDPNFFKNISFDEHYIILYKDRTLIEQHNKKVLEDLYFRFPKLKILKPKLLLNSFLYDFSFLITNLIYVDIKRILLFYELFWEKIDLNDLIQISEPFKVNNDFIIYKTDYYPLDQLMNDLYIKEKISSFSFSDKIKKLWSKKYITSDGIYFNFPITADRYVLDKNDIKIIPPIYHTSKIDNPSYLGYYINEPHLIKIIHPPFLQDYILEAETKNIEEYQKIEFQEI
jgi:hypothetical protein